MAQRIAAGDLTGEEIVVRSKDEIGDMAISMNKMQKNVKSMIISVAETRSRSPPPARILRHQPADHLQFRGDHCPGQRRLGSTEQVNRNLQTVSTGAEQMSSTIQDIAKNATESARVAAKPSRPRNPPT